MRRFVQYGLLSAVAAAVMVFAGCADEPTAVDNTPKDVTLAPPPAGQGFQIVLDTFAVPTGQEVQNNFYMKLPNTEDIYITKIEFRYNKGSHHLNIFKSDSVNMPDTVINDFTALDFTKWDMVAASQTEAFNWQLPPGVAFHLKAHQQMNFQTHFVNGGTQATPTGRGKVIVNFWTTAKSNVTNYGGALFANNRKISIPPKSRQTYCKVVKGFANDVNILLMTGHYHSRGKSFVVGHWDGTKLADTIYTNTTWDEPPVKEFSPTHLLRAGDSLAFITTFENRSDETIIFGWKVEKQEHANLFMFYYPALEGGKALYDYDGGVLMSTEPLN